MCQKTHKSGGFKIQNCLQFWHILSKNLEAQERSIVPHGKSCVAHEEVMKLAIGLEKYKRHCIAMDNYFTSILLLKELLSKNIYGMETYRANCIGLSSSLKNIQAFKRSL